MREHWINNLLRLLPKVRWLAIGGVLVLIFSAVAGCGGIFSGEIKWLPVNHLRLSEEGDVVYETGPSVYDTVVGPLLEYMVEQEMDGYDRQQLNYVFERAAAGEQFAWTNPKSNIQYSVKPFDFVLKGGVPCRKAEIEVEIEGKREKLSTTGCREESGNWVLE